MLAGEQASLRAANGPVNVPGWPAMAKPADGAADLPADGRCQGVRPGDTVRFSLRIDSAEGAKAVFAELQMNAKGRHGRFRETDLPMSRADVLAGGGVGSRDAADATLYHFSFAVPQVEPGMYHTAGFAVRAAYRHNEGARVAMDRRAREQVRGYCLAVFGGTHGPVVTEFLPKAVEHTAETEPALVLP